MKLKQFQKLSREAQQAYWKAYQKAFLEKKNGLNHSEYLRTLHRKITHQKPASLGSHNNTKRR